MSKNKTAISDYDVRVRAHRIWEKSGRPEGCAEDHWREALAELEAERLAATTPVAQVPAQPKVSTPPVRIAPAETVEAKNEAA